jgi:hypothetical protein
VGTYTIFGLYTLAASVLIWLLFKHLWDQHHDRVLQHKWQERERLLDRPRMRALWNEQHARPAGTPEENAPQGLEVAPAETAARVLFIVARDQRDLVTFLHKDFAIEEGEGVIEILIDRRRGPAWHGAEPRETDDRRDPHRDRMVSTSLREAGCAFVRQPAALPQTAPGMTDMLDPVAADR